MTPTWLAVCNGRVPMRKHFALGRLLLLPFVTALTAGACSSSSSNNQDLMDAGGPDATTDSTASSDSSHDTTASDTNAVDSPVQFDSGPPHDAQAACTAPVTNADGGDAGGGGEGGPTGVGQFETEPNDTAATANPLMLNGPECGAISPGTDVDFFTFTLPANTTNMNVSFDGNISLTFNDGTDPAVTISPGNTPQIPVKAGATYTVEVHSANGQPQGYAITINQN
jgi:hypothetical protein